MTAILYLVFQVWMPLAFTGPFLVLVAWLSRRAWPAWIGVILMLPLSLYLGLAPILFGAPLLSLSCALLGAVALSRKHTRWALGFFVIHWSAVVVIFFLIYG